LIIAVGDHWCQRFLGDGAGQNEAVTGVREAAAEGRQMRPVTGDGVTLAVLVGSDRRVSVVEGKCVHLEVHSCTIILLYP